MHKLAPACLAFVALAFACGGEPTLDPPTFDAGSFDAGVAQVDAGPAIDAGPSFDFEGFASLVQSAEAERRQFDVPGLALAIVERGVPSQAIGLGTTTRGGSVPVAADTRFSAGSISKSFIAAAAVDLADEGALDLDAPITTYVPEFGLAPPFDADEVTLRRLLSHTAGYPTWLPQRASDRTISPVDPAGLSMYFASRSDVALWVEPGQLWNYSNIGYSLAALVTERAGMGWWDVIVDERVITPLGLDTATFHPGDVVNATFALGHADFGNGEQLVGPDQWGYSSIGSPNGGLWISAQDLSRFAAFLVAPEPSHAPMQIAQARTKDSYGLGLSMFEYKGVQVVGHSGAIPGFQAIVLAVPEASFGVAVMVNSDRYNVMRLATMAIDRFVAPTGEDVVPDDPPTREQLEGTYVDDHGYLGSLTIRAEGAGYRIVFDDLMEERALMHFEGSTYFVRDAPELPGIGQRVPTVVFDVWTDDSGRVVYLASRLGVAGR